MTDGTGTPGLFEFVRVGDVDVVRGPAIPSGPLKAPPAPSANTREAYWSWRRTAEGKRVWALIATTADEAARFGEKRISTKRLVEYVRGVLKVEINNSWTAYIADELIERWPHLSDLIERRRRKKVR